MARRQSHGAKVNTFQDKPKCYARNRPPDDRFFASKKKYSIFVLRNSVTIAGSNSKFLSKDIVTEFRGRATEIHMYPLSFAEFLTAYDGPESESFLQYINYGGLPQILSSACGTS